MPCHIECEPVTEASLAAAGSPIFDALRKGFSWNVSYGDEEELERLQAARMAPIVHEGVIVDGTDAATRPTPSSGFPQPSPAKMPATIIRPESRVRGRRWSS